ncbi:YidB family protein [Streptomyces sp. x-80]|uniref:YidB family protein n=1 Tax=Streptomyces sp. x-80 TaxID=2789282 RepID=UPI0039810297
MAGNDLGSLLDALLGDGSGRLLGTLLDAVGGAGTTGGGGNPLDGLLAELREGGMADQVQSWVGTGANRSISGPEIAQALPYQALDHVAQQGGVSPEEAADRIAATLPRAVDKLTPAGELPQGSLEDLIRQRM